MPLTRLKLGSIADGALITAKLADDAVTAAKLAPNITDSGTGHTQVARGTTAQRTSGVTGMLRYNTTVDVLEQYSASGWVGIEPAASGGSLSISGGITVAEAITINGTGHSSGGAIIFTANNNTYSGAITLGATSTIVSTGGAQTISATTNGGNGLTITADGNLVISGIVGGSTELTTYAVTTTGSASQTFSANVTTTALKTGNALPPGMSLNSTTGVISGAPAAVETDTTTTFIIIATDAENQTSERSFSITVQYASVYSLILGDT